MDMKNKKVIICIFLLGVTLFVSGCGSSGPNTGKIWGRQEPSLAPVPESTFEEGQQAYLQKSYTIAAAKMGAYSDAHPRTSRGMEARYWQGISLLELGHIRRGRMLLGEVNASNQVGRNTKALAMRATAKSYLNEQNYEKAEAIYLRLKAEYPDESDNSEISAALAQCQGCEIVEPSANIYAVNPGEKRYIVQAGIFTSRAFADRLVNRLQQNGFQAIVMNRENKYFVQAGSFSTLQRAQNQAGQLKSRGFEAIVK